MSGKISVYHPIPERCLLVQAARWFIYGILPQQYDYQLPPVELKSANAELLKLFLALRAKNCDVKGKLWVEIVKVQEGPSGERPRIVESEGSRLLFSDAITKEIDDVHPADIDFTNSKIWAYSGDLGGHAWRQFEQIFEKYPPDEGWKGLCSFRDVTLDFSKLMLFFAGKFESLSPPNTQGGQITTDPETQCENWLYELMRGGDPPTRKKDDYFKEARAQFAVSQRGFVSAWKSAIRKSRNKTWSRPGRKS